MLWPTPSTTARRLRALHDTVLALTARQPVTATVTTGSGGRGTATWPEPLDRPPRVVATARATSTTTATLVEVVDVTATGCTVRTWRTAAKLLGLAAPVEPVSAVVDVVGLP